MGRRMGAGVKGDRDRTSAFPDEKGVLEMDRGNGCTTMRRKVLNTTELCILKWLRWKLLCHCNLFF
jgi:hypothetical protein